MINEFLNKLYSAAADSGLDAEKITKKYENRLALAKEAGLSDAETLEKFGSVEDIIKKEKQFGSATVAASVCSDDNLSAEKADGDGETNTVKAENFINYVDADGVISESVSNFKAIDGHTICKLDEGVCSFNAKLSYVNDLYIVSSNESGLKVKTTGNIAEFYRITTDITDGKKELIICPQYNDLKSKKVKGDIYIEIGPNFKFGQFSAKHEGSGYIIIERDVFCESFNVFLTSGDLKAENIDALKGLNLSVVSGDAEFKNANCENANLMITSGNVCSAKLACDNLKVTVVSGEVEIKQAKIRNFMASAVSGDILINGEIGAYKTSVVSGEVTINGNIVSENVADKITNSFSFNPFKNK